MNNKGYTLIEMLIAAAFAVIIGVFIYGAYTAATSHGSITFGINGLAEVRCINGYQFAIGQRGDIRQVMDQYGKGVRCADQATSN